MSSHPRSVPGPEASEVTALLRQWTAGEPAVADELVPLIYGRLRSMAARYLSNERRELTLQPTALVHEAYIRLAGIKQIRWQDRGHFFAVAARAMRRILVERARRNNRLKRGGGLIRVELEQAEGHGAGLATDVLMLDLALRELADIDPFKAAILELRFFAGLSVAEVAESLGCSTATVHRHSALAKAWLVRELSAEEKAS